MTMTLQAVADKLMAAADICILIHQNPDGDAVGSAFALYHALRGAGRRVDVLCADPLPALYDFIYPKDGYEPEGFEPGFILSVDLASPPLMGRYKAMALEVDICIDHHPTNTGYAKATYLDAGASAAGEIILDLIDLMGLPVTEPVADALYLAISSDTGGFRYANTTAVSLRKAARLMEAGARSGLINHRLFESMPCGLALVQGRLMADMAFYYDGLCAVIKLPFHMLADNGLAENDTDGISAIPRGVAGVEVGVTIKERPAEGRCRVSLRSTTLDSSAICARFGGGGHRLAAGCTLRGSLAEAEAVMVAAIGDALREAGLLQ